jgi:hypothetical protein
MNKCVMILLAVFYLICAPLQSRAQEAEIQQLILNIQKLNQLRQILSQLKSGYQILTKGYETIKNLSEGNFNIHKTFLDGLLQVSPTVRKYYRIVDIIKLQKQLIDDCKATLNSRKASNLFSQNEISYLVDVYEDIIDRSRKNLEELLLVITANQLRMNDEQRLQAIDRIYADLTHKKGFLQDFNSKGALLQSRRQRAMEENNHLQKLFNVK